MGVKVINYFSRTVKSLLLPILVFAVFRIASNGRFGQWHGMVTISRQAVVPILLALAITFNMSMGLWDFSAGAVVVFAAILGGGISNSLGLGIPGLVIFCIVVAVLMTTVTASLYRVMRVPSMVLTIGLVLIYETLPHLVYNGGGTILSSENTMLALSPWCFIVLGIMFAIFYFIYNYTPFGHNVRALGGNQAIAQNVGLNPMAIKFKSFIFGGIFLGMAAAINISTRGIVKPGESMSSIGLVFDAMMGIFIAMFLSRFCNMAIGVVIGTFTMKMLNGGLVALGLSTTIRDITTGLFLLILLCISSNQGRVSDWNVKRKKAKIANEKYARLEV
jgi:ribose transport system permease protein